MGFTGLPETIKNMRQQFSRHWISGNKGQWSPNTTSKWPESCDCLIVLVRREFPGHSAGRRNTGKSWKTPWVEKTELSLRRLRQLEFTGQSVGEERATWLHVSTEGTPQVLSRVLRSTVPARIPPEPKEEHLKAFVGLWSRSSHGVRNSACYPVILKNLINHRVLGKVLRKVLPQWWAMLGF